MFSRMKGYTTTGVVLCAVFFYVIGNSVGIPYHIKRHCVLESAVRGEEYIAVLSAHARKCASSAHFVHAGNEPRFMLV